MEVEILKLKECGLKLEKTQAQSLKTHARKKGLMWCSGFELVHFSTVAGKMTSSKQLNTLKTV